LVSPCPVSMPDRASRVPTPSRSIQSTAPDRATIANSNRWLYGKIRLLLTAADFDCRTANPATRQRWLERLHYSIIHWAAPELIPGERLRYTDKFDDPNLPGDIRVTVALKKVSVGTELDIVQEVLPDVIPPEACYLGYQESPRNLARLVEPEISHSPPRHAWPGAHPCLHRPRSRSCG
jgi:hypothetical protein